MDPSIKQYADSLYEKALFESASAVRRESVKCLQERAKTNHPCQPFSGKDYQAHVRIYAEHIERATAARFDSYQKAFGEINRAPTQGELNEILNDFKAIRELQINQSNQALSGVLAARNAPPGLDLMVDLRANSAHGHDRVLQEWKIWRGRVQLRQNAASTSGRRSLNEVFGSRAASQSAASKSFAANSAGDRSDGSARRPVAFISYSWDSDAHKKWVLGLASQLRKDGVEVLLDQWDLQLGGDKTVFMEKSVTNSHFVILICTPDYARKANGREGGVGYEAMIITGALAKNINQTKFIPVLRLGEWNDSSLPVWIENKTGVDLRGNLYSDAEYEKLLRALHNEPLRAPPVGPKPVFENGPPADQEIEPPDWALGALQNDGDLSFHQREAIRRKLSIARVHALHPRLTIWLTNRSDHGVLVKSASLWHGNAGRDYKRLNFGVPSDNRRFVDLGPHTENTPIAFATDEDAMLKLQILGIVDRHLPTFSFREDVDLEVRVEYDLLGVDDEYRETVRVGVHGNRQVESL